MRKIKFRGLSKSNCWVYGTPVFYNNGDACIYNDLCPRYGCEATNIANMRIDVYEDSIDEFTGILDKNGKEIYEGDIVECSDNSSNDLAWGLDKKHIGHIVFIDGSFMLKCFKERRRSMGNVESYYNEYIFLDKWLNAESTVVMGNIYENRNILSYDLYE